MIHSILEGSSLVVLRDPEELWVFAWTIGVHKALVAMAIMASMQQNQTKVSSNTIIDENRLIKIASNNSFKVLCQLSLLLVFSAMTPFGGLISVSNSVTVDGRILFGLGCASVGSLVYVAAFELGERTREDFEGRQERMGCRALTALTAGAIMVWLWDLLVQTC